MPEIEIQTRIAVPPMPFTLDFASGIVSLGSCFSDEIGALMADSGFHIESNPFGTLYNPASIASALHRLMYDTEITPDDLVEHEGLWHSWHHHGSFSRPTAEECLEVCNSRIHQAHQALKQASLLIVTFGSAWVYCRVDKLDVDKLISSPDNVSMYQPTNVSTYQPINVSTYQPTNVSTYQRINVSTQVVANCHKVPQENFVRRCLSVDDVVALWKPLLLQLHTLFPRLHTLFTVSPIRHIGDGLHGNQLSKSTLLLAIDQLVDRDLPQAKKKKKGTHPVDPDSPVTVYFPSYEIVLDELRDYRFFGPDMAHPAPLAVEWVWDRFQRCSMVPAVRDQAHFNRKQKKRERHIPLHDK